MYHAAVLETRHYTDTLFSFRTTRPQSFRFRSGEFAMVGLESEGKPLLRAYSIASPSWAETLEFFSIKVPNGPLTSRLQKIRTGDEIIINKKPTGTLVLDALLPGKTLYLISTGTGLAPFASIVRDPETYERYEHVILTHSCRWVAELAYGFELIKSIEEDDVLREIVGGRLTHFTSVTREPHTNVGRITKLIEDGTLFSAVGEKRWDPASDRVMICGSTEMNQDVSSACERHGLTEGSNSRPADFVIEKAFVG
ncbi:MAG: ferredoxin--NADP reductase [Pseudomonadota bacterium]